MKSSKDARVIRQETNSFIPFILLILVSLCLGLLPTLGFGQTADPFSKDAGSAGKAPVSFDTGAFAPSATPAAAPAPVQLPPSQPSLPPAPAPAPTHPQTAAQVPAALNPSGPPSVPAMPNAPPKPGARPTPPPVAPEKVGAVANSKPPQPSRQEKPRTTFATAATEIPTSPTAAQLQQNPKLLQSVPSPGHPLVGYLEPPDAAQSMVRGKTLTVAELLDGVKNASSRRRLLQTYWDLMGILAEYNCRVQAERQAGGPNAPRDAGIRQTVSILQQQRKAAEIDFVKKQWELAELMRQHKGVSVAETELPIPSDYPLVRRYETHADKIARTERSRYVGRMIPIQEQLLQARHRACVDTFEMFRNIPTDSQQLLIMFNQRTEAFLGMSDAIVEYNRMIADYASETIGPGVSQYQLVGALIELPKSDSTPPENRQDRQMASPDTLKLGGVDAKRLPEGPEPQPVSPAMPIAENRANDVPAVAYDQRPRPEGEADRPPAPPRRRGHPDVTPAAFESVAAPEGKPKGGAISQAGHLEAREPVEPPPVE